MAVRKESGKDPDVFVSMQRTLGQGHVEPLALTLGRELRSRYLNPKWIEGMKKENYAGAREMAEFLENMWGWQVTTPKVVDAAKWEQTYEVYVEDKYGLEIEKFFNKANPWAYQSITARMLEAVRKGYWKADEKVKKKLAAEYALNVVEKGVACCDHTCNNPLLNQMVMNIISLPGVLSPEVAEQFKLAVEQAARKPLDQLVAEREEILKKLQEGLRKAAPGASDPVRDPSEAVEGYKMEEMDQKDETTRLTSSGIQWAASLFVLLLIGLFVWGSRRRR
jgi:cobaltochelatase CobN